MNRKFKAMSHFSQRLSVILLNLPIHDAVAMVQDIKDSGMSYLFISLGQIEALVNRLRETYE